MLFLSFFHFPFPNAAPEMEKRGEKMLLVLPSAQFWEEERLTWRGQKHSCPPKTFFRSPLWKSSRNPPEREYLRLCLQIPQGRRYYAAAPVWTSLFSVNVCIPALAIQKKRAPASWRPSVRNEASFKEKWGIEPASLDPTEPVGVIHWLKRRLPP